MNNVTSNYSGVVEWDLFTAGDIGITVGLLNREHNEEQQQLMMTTSDILQASGQTLSTSVQRNNTLYTLSGMAIGEVEGQELYHFTLTPSMGSLHSVCTLNLDGETEATLFLNAEISTCAWKSRKPR